MFPFIETAEAVPSGLWASEGEVNAVEVFVDLGNAGRVGGAVAASSCRVVDLAGDLAEVHRFCAEFLKGETRSLFMRSSAKFAGRSWDRSVTGR